MEKEKYQLLRKQKSYIYWRMLRRTNAILDVLDKIIKRDKKYYLLDIGTFDGFIASAIKKNFNNIICFGLDNSLSDNTFDSIFYIIADALALPFRKACFDIVLLPAVIEHITDTKSVLEQINRILKNSGYLILTYPNPFFDYISSKLKDTGHKKRFTFNVIKNYLVVSGFFILKFDAFLLFPFPRKEKPSIFERFIRKSFLKFSLLNRLILAKKIY
ncbi:MAG: class I SAM-dependent methyltransferase [Candidatus Omnitrophica bacterium]|nr:class I SAM-dependent methyltransferase [Candidatus Omnitrophota bacterium]MCM8831045.1 class I SAM-dependent methyltransferase [Candidatus Omnitrophota bacterium]